MQFRLILINEDRNIRCGSNFTDLNMEVRNQMVFSRRAIIANYNA